jgi:hypothetical protein
MKWALRIAIIVGIIGVLTIGLLWLFRPYRPIPQSIKSQLTTTLLMPRIGDYQEAYGTAGYDSVHNLLTFKIGFSGTDIVVSEQPEPTQFNDISGYYTAFVNDLGEYTSFGSINGTVYLFHPKTDPTKTAAVMVQAGTLMFANPNSNITMSQWRSFFNAVQAVR